MDSGFDYDFAGAPTISSVNYKVPVTQHLPYMYVKVRCSIMLCALLQLVAEYNKKAAAAVSSVALQICDTVFSTLLIREWSMWFNCILLIILNGLVFNDELLFGCMEFDLIWIDFTVPDVSCADKNAWPVLFIGQIMLMVAAANQIKKEESQLQ